MRTARVAEGVIMRLEWRFMTAGKPAGSPKQGKLKVKLGRERDILKRRLCDLIMTSPSQRECELASSTIY